MAEKSTKTKKENRRILNVIMAIIMLTSIVGFGVIMGQKQDTNPTPTKPAPETPTTLTFTAEKVNGEVKKILSVIKLSGYTNEPNISVLDKKLFSVKGVSNLISSKYENDPQNNLIYIAELTTKVPDENVSGLIDNIKNTLGLLDIFVVKKALVKLPSKLKMNNADLNLVKEFVFEEPFTETLVESQTIADDSIELSLIIKASGDKILSRTAYETQNISLTPEWQSIEAPIEIEELKFSLVFSGPADYNGFDLNVLETSISKEIEGTTFVKLALDKFEPIAYLGVLKSAIKDENTLKTALQNSIGNVMLVNSLDFSSDENKLIAKINVNSQENYSAIVDITSSLMRDLGFDNNAFAFKPIKVDILGETRYTTKELYDTALKLEKLLKNNYIFVTARQKADVRLVEPLKVKEKTYDYNELFSGVLVPNHNEKEKIVAKLNFAVQRGKIAYIQAVEDKDLIDLLKEKPIVVKTE